MEFFYFLLIVLLLILPFRTHAKYKALAEELAALRKRLSLVENRLDNDSVPDTGTKQVIPDKVIQPQKEEIVEDISEPVSENYDDEAVKEISAVEDKSVWGGQAIPRANDVNFADKVRTSFEQNIATKLPVWIGAISIILSAFFLVKYSVEFGLLGPLARVSLGALFSAGLIAAGHWVSRRPNLANGERIKQGLMGAGLVGLYVSVYASIHLYEFLSPTIGFICMGIVTAMAVILSLYHGQAIAIFGLIGGLLTPFFVSSEQPNVVGLFAYLFVLYAGLFAILVRKGWWLLAVFALIGMFGWSAIWLFVAFAPSDGLVLLLFAMGLCAVVFSATHRKTLDEDLDARDQRAIDSLNLIAIGGAALTVFWFSFKITLSLFDWSMLGLLTLGLFALSYYKPAAYQKALLAKLALDIVLLLSWGEKAGMTEIITIIGVLSLLYVGTTTMLMRKVADPRFWSSVQTASAMILYLCAYGLLHDDIIYPYFWGTVSIILAGLFVYQTAEIKKNYAGEALLKDHLLAIYASIASAFISLGAAIELPWSYISLAIAAQLLFTAWIYTKVNINFLPKIMLALSVIFAALNIQQILLFLNVSLYSAVGEVTPTSSLTPFLIDNPLYNLGASLIFFAASLWVLLKAQKNIRSLNNVLFGTALTLLVFVSAYIFDNVFHSAEAMPFSEISSFFERNSFTVLLGVLALVIMRGAMRYNIEDFKLWGESLFLIALIRFVYFELLIHNPYWSEGQLVGSWPLVNGVTLAYGAGLCALFWVFKNLKDFKWITATHLPFLSGVALCTVFALVTLNVRQFFHGEVLSQGAVGTVELYSYSVVWILTGIALLYAGMRTKQKSLRMAAVGFITLSVFKVFLIDAAELEGLFRVFSFLGLGISLIGLSYFYTRFVMTQEKLEDAP